MQYYKQILKDTPVGELLLIATDKHLVYLGFNNHSDDEMIFKLFGNKYIDSLNGIIDKTIKQLGEYFYGERKTFDIPIYYEGTRFQKQVWQALQHIPYGETWNYSDIAKYVGRPKAVRAVGGANHINRISIIIPCHRVIGKSGKLVGYGGGIDRKITLLELEKNNKD